MSVGRHLWQPQREAQLKQATHGLYWKILMQQGDRKHEQEVGGDFQHHPVRSYLRCYFDPNFLRLLVLDECIPDVNLRLNLELEAKYPGLELQQQGYLN
jgi:hypothetical protein